MSRGVCLARSERRPRGAFVAVRRCPARAWTAGHRRCSRIGWTSVNLPGRSVAACVMRSDARAANVIALVVRGADTAVARTGKVAAAIARCMASRRIVVPLAPVHFAATAVAAAAKLLEHADDLAAARAKENSVQAAASIATSGTAPARSARIRSQPPLPHAHGSQPQPGSQPPAQPHTSPQPHAVSQQPVGPVHSQIGTCDGSQQFHVCPPYCRARRVTAAARCLAATANLAAAGTWCTTAAWLAATAAAQQATAQPKQVAQLPTIAGRGNGHGEHKRERQIDAHLYRSLSALLRGRRNRRDASGPQTSAPP